jgi:Immunity protein 8
VILELKRLHSPELPHPGDVPKDPTCACVMVYAEVGVLGTETSETFYFSVCTRKWLERELEQKSIVYGHGRIIVHTFDWDLVSEAIDGLVRGVEAKTWEQAVGKLRLSASWEKEGL